jgi:hypothetical protein
MRSMARLIPALFAMLLAVPAGAGTNDVPEYRSSDNLELIDQYHTTTTGSGGGGTDLEFFTRELREWVDVEGTRHVLDEEDPPVTRHFALVGNWTNGSGGPTVIDITNPEDTYIVSRVPSCTPSQGDIQVRADGMVAAIAKQGGTCTVVDPDGIPRPVGNGSVLVDLADVYDPRAVGHALHNTSGHNNTIHPSGDYLYISSSGKTPPTVPIYDITDPTNPVKVRDLTFPDGNSPHDIRFSDDGTRAYMAGVNRYRIVDTTDPENPTQISSFQAGGTDSPGSTIGHDALVSPDGRFLFLGDELNGGGTAPCPGGAIYTYDLEDETAPRLIGMAWAGGGPVTSLQAVDHPDNAGAVGGCTSHVMDMNPDGKSLSIGWYVLGTRTFSWESLYNADGTPKDVSGVTLTWGSLSTGDGLVETGYMIPATANTWSAKQYSEVPGYIFSDDLTHGFYVTKIKS